MKFMGTLHTYFVSGEEKDCIFGLLCAHKHFNTFLVKKMYDRIEIILMKVGEKVLTR